MTFEVALPELRKLLFTYKQKLLSIDRFLLQVDSILNSIKTEELTSFIKYQNYRDRRRNFSYMDNATGNSIDFPLAEMIGSLEAIVVELQRKVLETDFIFRLDKEKMTREKKIKGLNELKHKTKVEDFNVLTWLDILYDVGSKVFGFTSNEAKEIQTAIGEYQEDLLKHNHSPKELVYKYKLKTNEILDSYISALSLGKFDEETTTDEKKSQSKNNEKEISIPEFETKPFNFKANNSISESKPNLWRGYFWALLAISIAAFLGLWPIAKDVGYKRFDTEKINLIEDTARISQHNRKLIQDSARLNATIETLINQIDILSDREKDSIK